MSGKPEQIVEAGKDTQFGSKEAAAAGVKGAASRYEREILNDADILDLVACSVKHLRGVMNRKSVNTPTDVEDDERKKILQTRRLAAAEKLAGRRDKIALEIVKTYIGPNVVTRLTDNARARNGKGKGEDGKAKGKGMGASVLDAAEKSAPEGNA